MKRLRWHHFRDDETVEVCKTPLWKWQDSQIWWRRNLKRLTMTFFFCLNTKKSRRNVGRHWKESSNSGRLAIIIINEKTFLINNFCKALYTWLAYYVEWISRRASVRWVYCSNINYDIHTNSQIKYKTFTIYQSSNVCIQH